MFGYKFTLCWAVFLVFLLPAMASGAITYDYSGQTLVMPSGPFISSEYDDTVRLITPDRARNGGFFVRQKFEDPWTSKTRYQLHEGLRTPKTIHLISFQLPGELIAPFQEKFSEPFFYRSPEGAWLEATRVYFDDQFVYVEDHDQLFYRIGTQFTPLLLISRNVQQVGIRTNPPGAEVYLAGLPRGFSPHRFHHTHPLPVSAYVYLTDYYPVHQWITQPGEVINIHLEGLPLPGTSQAGPTNRQQVLAAFDARYPTLESRRPGETPEEFEERRKLWESFRQKNLQSIQDWFRNPIQNAVHASTTSHSTHRSMPAPTHRGDKSKSGWDTAKWFVSGTFIAVGIGSVVMGLLAENRANKFKTAFYQWGESYRNGSTTHEKYVAEARYSVEKYKVKKDEAFVWWIVAGSAGGAALITLAF
jgi:hypothetical protein